MVDPAWRSGERAHRSGAHPSSNSG